MSRIQHEKSNSRKELMYVYHYQLQQRIRYGSAGQSAMCTFGYIFGIIDSWNSRSYKEPCGAPVSSIEIHFYQQGSSLPEWEVSFVERCHHLLLKWPVAVLVLSLSFVSQWMEWSEERGAVKDTDAENISNEWTKN